MTEEIKLPFHNYLLFVSISFRPFAYDFICYLFLQFTFRSHRYHFILQASSRHMSSVFSIQVSHVM